MKLYKSNTGNYNFVMAYPAIEEFALSSLGYMWLYRIADTMEGINAIRCSTDNTIISSKKIDSLAFSISFDFDFMGVFKILDTLNIPFLKKDRDNNTPLIFAGGPVITTNPKPYEAFFDFMVIGDGETTFAKVLELLRDNHCSKIDLLEKLKEIEGVDIPNNKVIKTTEQIQNVIILPLLVKKVILKILLLLKLREDA